ncbi:hypothetical protein BGZ68_000210 [Mortierella alpina]|nr:hypothetical protein BGZ68_000210 [Mortierella alpina]
MSKWQLHRELDASAGKGDQLMTMEVRLSNEALFSQLNPGSIEIQFIELNSQRPRSRGLNGNGDYVAILFATLRQLILELWDLSCAPLSARLLATKRVPLARCEDSKNLQPEYPFTVALSWDASQVAMMYTGFYHREPPLLLDFQDHFGLYRSASAHSYLPSVADYRRCTKLHNFTGVAMFHIIEPATQDSSEELFIASNGMEIKIYSVHGDWKLIRTITITCAEKTQNNTFFALECIRNLRGRYFRQYDNYSNVFVIWDIVEGAVVSYIPRKGPSTMWTMIDDAKTSVSDDGAYMAFYRQGEITTYRRASGTLQQSRTLPPLYEDVSDMRFIRKNSHILVFTGAQDEEFGPGKLGLILDVATLSIQDRFVLPSGKNLEWFPRYGKDTQLYFTTHEAIGLVDVDDYIVRPYSGRYLTRHEHCEGPLTPLNRQPTTFSSTELVFTARITSSTQSRQLPSSSVVVRVTSNSGLSRTFTVPPLTASLNSLGERVEREYSTVAFLSDFSRLVVMSSDTLMIWSLPSTLEGDFILLLIWSTADLPRRNAWVTCPHQQLYSSGGLQSERGVPVVYPDADHPFTSEHAKPFLDGLATALELFDETMDDNCRRAILGYVGSHINSCPVSDNPSANVMSTICSAWTPESHQMHEHFTAALLSPGCARWIPGFDMDGQMNPLFILLKKCETEPRAIDLAEVIIDYCIRQTREDKDLIFLLPVMQCLGDLAARNKPHWDLALRTLQRLAYLPVKKRSYIVDNHKIAYPTGLQWTFWKRKQLPIYKCKDPVLQLKHSTSGRDSQNDNFTRDLHVASFDFLWHYMADGPHQAAPSLKSDKVAIECHNLKLEAFDNPAVVALIEYKWNTIGVKYWLARFLFQCCYYILVLTTVLMQVYPLNYRVLPGMFIAIIILSSVFLWLEAIQLARDWSRYLSSVYNYVDLAAFGLPLAGSINQLVAFWSKDGGGSNSGVLSFSVLFVSLHILFELRINKSVCHYVTIIIRIFSEIRAFFLIFAGGIIAFTIAILHLLYACLGDECPEPVEGGFSRHFYHAISSTYFFMGGRYDSINDSLDSQNWAFHTMMIIYFFFTVILMLNVLIGLVNLAFNDGDKTWRLVWLKNRLRYIESAENLSYRVPGLRQAYDCFPKEIYYSSTPQSMTECTRRVFGEDGKGELRASTVIQTWTGSRPVQCADPAPKDGDPKYDETSQESQEGQSRSFEQLREQLKDEFKRELQEQLKEQRREQQQLFQTQIKILQEHMSALMKSGP